VKRRLEEILQALIAPIRARRAELADDRDHVVDVIRRGTLRAREITERTKRDVMQGLGLFQL
jgi:tryptophanyl-tRNA synthetase